MLAMFVAAGACALLAGLLISRLRRRPGPVERFAADQPSPMRAALERRVRDGGIDI